MNQSTHKLKQELKAGQARTSLWHFTLHTHLICLVSLHNPGSKASQNQSKHEPHIIKVCKARSLRSWRCVGASTMRQQRQNKEMDEMTRLDEIPFEQQETLLFTVSLESGPMFYIS
jgi:hypothetical protein